MSTAADPVEDDTQKGSKAPLLLGIALAIAGAGGGFIAVQMGFLGSEQESYQAEHEMAGDDSVLQELHPASFVALDTIVVNLPDHSDRNLLRFTAQLEVALEHTAEVEAIKPRIVDVLNSYLRAVDIVDLSEPSALVRLRSQMLRRVQVVTGEGRVTDLLIMEFVLN